MNRIDRLVAILIQLQSKRVVTAGEIADRFKISIRTVYRDIRALEEAGIPLGSEAGKGYYIVDGYHLPPVMFNREEAEAMLFAGKLMERFSDREIKQHFDSALFKIKSILKTSEKDHLETLQSRIKVDTTPLSAMGDRQSSLLFALQAAAGSKQVVNLDYYSHYKDTRTMRPVEPLGLYFYGSGWHLIAFCRLRKDYRDFRVSRIHSLSQTQESFATEHHQSLERVIQGFSERTHLIPVSVIFNQAVLDSVNEQKYFQGFTKEIVRGNRIEMHFMVSSLPYFGNWLLFFTDQVEILAPSDLKVYLRDLTQNYPLTTDNSQRC